MKEFVEKLIERLEEYKDSHLIEHDSEECLHCKEKEDDWCDCRDCIICVWDKAKAIVKEIAQEYSTDTPQKSLDGWIPVTERLPKYDVLSEYYEEVIVTLDDGRVTVGCYCNLYKEWWVNAESGTKHAINATGHVIAWQPLPEPYKAEKQAKWKDAVMSHFMKVE